LDPINQGKGGKKKGKIKITNGTLSEPRGSDKALRVSNWWKRNGEPEK